MNDLSLDDGSYKHIVSKQNDPNDLSKYQYELDYYPNDNMTSGKIQILSRIRNLFPFKTYKSRIPNKSISAL